MSYQKELQLTRNCLDSKRVIYGVKYLEKIVNDDFDIIHFGDNKESYVVRSNRNTGEVNMCHTVKNSTATYWRVKNPHEHELLHFYISYCFEKFQNFYFLKENFTFSDLLKKFGLEEGIYQELELGSCDLSEILLFASQKRMNIELFGYETYIDMFSYPGTDLDSTKLALQTILDVE